MCTPTSTPPETLVLSKPFTFHLLRPQLPVLRGTEGLGSPWTPCFLFFGALQSAPTHPCTGPASDPAQASFLPIPADGPGVFGSPPLTPPGLSQGLPTPCHPLLGHGAHWPEVGLVWADPKLGGLNVTLCLLETLPPPCPSPGWLSLTFLWVSHCSPSHLCAFAPTSRLNPLPRLRERHREGTKGSGRRAWGGGAVHTSWVAAMLGRKKMQAGPTRLLSTE